MASRDELAAAGSRDHRGRRDDARGVLPRTADGRDLDRRESRPSRRGRRARRCGTCGRRGRARPMSPFGSPPTKDCASGCRRRRGCCRRSGCDTDRGSGRGHRRPTTSSRADRNTSCAAVCAGPTSKSASSTDKFDTKSGPCAACTAAARILEHDLDVRRPGTAASSTMYSYEPRAAEIRARRRTRRAARRTRADRSPVTRTRTRRAIRPSNAQEAGHHRMNAMFISASDVHSVSIQRSTWAGATP